MAMRGGIFATRSSASQPLVSFLPCGALNHAASPAAPPRLVTERHANSSGEGQADSSPLPARVGFRPGRSLSQPWLLPPGTTQLPTLPPPPSTAQASQTLPTTSPRGSVLAPGRGLTFTPAPAASGPSAAPGPPGKPLAGMLAARPPCHI